jgi:hypothetical protein
MVMLPVGWVISTRQCAITTPHGASGEQVQLLIHPEASMAGKKGGARKATGKKSTLAKARAKQRTGTHVGFAAVKASAAKSGARNPGAVAASVGRKKYGNAGFQALAAAGRKKAAAKKATSKRKTK